MQECFLSLVPQHTCSSGEREINGKMDTFGWTDVWKHRRIERGIDDRLVEWMDEQLAYVWSGTVGWETQELNYSDRQMNERIMEG